MADIEVIGTLLLGIAAVYRDALCRESSNLLTLKEQHKELWKGVSSRPELKRLFQMDIDALTVEPKPEEEEFLNLVFVHFQTGWSLAKFGLLISRTEISDDLRDFFRFPLRRAIWEKTKRGRNQEFVRFVVNALKKK